MGSFLSLYFDELVNLDTQDERYDDSILEYVDTYQPDIVMIMLMVGCSRILRHLNGWEDEKDRKSIVRFKMLFIVSFVVAF